MKSKELRIKAWDSLKGKYWTAFFVSLITGIIYSLGASVLTYAQKMMEIPAAVNPADMDSVAVTGALVIIGMAIVVMCVGLIINIFVGNLALIGCCNYFIKNTDSKPSFSDAFSAYKIRYRRNVWAILLIDIKVVLWTILLVVPGIIKIFEYSIVPYILADDDSISVKEAFKKAKQMMKGNKWRLFKLNFSFIGWYLLSGLTLGIGALFLVPYVDAANAEFYMELKNK